MKKIYFKYYDNAYKLYSDYVSGRKKGYKPSITFVRNKFCLILIPAVANLWLKLNKKP